MNIKKASSIINDVNDVVKRWPAFAEEQKVKPDKRDQILSTLNTH